MASFFQLLAQQLSRSLAADCVFIGEWKPQMKRLAVVAASGTAAEAMPPEFDLLNTPFQAPGAPGPNGPFAHKEGAEQHFPQDPVLQRVHGESYVGAPLRDSSGNLLGVMGVISKRRLEDPGQAEGLLNVISLCAAHEMESSVQLQAALRENAQLRRSLTEGGEAAPSGAPAAAAPVTLEEAQRGHVQRTLDACHWVIEGPRGAAAVLKLPPSTLRSLMKRLGIRRAPKAGQL